MMGFHGREKAKEGKALDGHEGHDAFCRTCCGDVGSLQAVTDMAMWPFSLSRRFQCVLS